MHAHKLQAKSYYYSTDVQAHTRARTYTHNVSLQHVFQVWSGYINCSVFLVERCEHLLLTGPHTTSHCYCQTQHRGVQHTCVRTHTHTQNTLTGLHNLTISLCLPVSLSLFVSYYLSLTHNRNAESKCQLR